MGNSASTPDDGEVHYTFEIEDRDYDLIASKLTSLSDGIRYGLKRSANMPSDKYPHEVEAFDYLEKLLPEIPRIAAEIKEEGLDKRSRERFLEEFAVWEWNLHYAKLGCKVSITKDVKDLRKLLDAPKRKGLR